MDELLTFGVGVDTSAAEAGLASLGSSADGVAAGLEDRLSSASDGMKNLGKSSAGASRGIQGLAAVVSLVDPRLGQVVRSVGTLTRGLSVLRLGLGPAAAAVALVTGALALYQHEQRKSEEAAAAAEQRTRDLTLALEDQHAIYLDLQTQIDLINGDTDRFAVQFEKRRAQIESTGQAVTDALDAEIAAVEEKIRVQEQERRVSLEQQATVRGLREELAELNQERQDAVDATDSQVAAAEAYSEYLREQQESEEFLRKRAEARRAAARASAEAERQEAEARRERQQQEQAYAALVSEVTATETQARRALMTDEERIKASLDDRLQRLQQISQETDGLIDVEAAEIALRRQAAMELTDLDRQRHEARMQQLEAEQQKAKAVAEEQRQAALQQLQVGTDLASSLAGLAVQTAGDTKSARIAEARINQLLAITNAIARNPGPIGALQGAAAAASIEAQIAAMRSITAHRGAMYGDEYMVKARSGEAHLSNMGRQMVGDENIKRANRGQSPRGVNVTVRQMYEHRGFNRFADDNLKIGGPMRAAIRSSSSTLTGFDVN